MEYINNIMKYHKLNHYVKREKAMRHRIDFNLNGNYHIIQVHNHDYNIVNKDQKKQVNL